MEKVLYVDLDGTLLDTEDYLHKIFTANGVKYSKNKSIVNNYKRFPENSLELSLIKESLSDYSVIPWRVSAMDSLKLLRTEFRVVLVSGYVWEFERKAKEIFASSLGLSIILCKNADRSEIDMGNAYYIDDSILNICDSNVRRDKSYALFNKYNSAEYSSDECINLVSEGCKIFMDWVDLTSAVMEVEVDAELRDFICSRVKRFSSC